MARDRRASKVLYNSDATLITQNESVEATDANNTRMAANKAMNEMGATIQVADFFDTLVSYSPFRWFGSVKGMGTGTCVLCGKETREDIRRICGECLDRYQSVLYRKTKEALNNGESYINI